MAKLLQLKKYMHSHVEDTPEYKMNQERNYERYLFVMNKYKAHESDD